MIKKIAWDTFKNTGDINTFLEYKEIDNLISDGYKLKQAVLEISNKYNIHKNQLYNNYLKYKENDNE